MPFLRTEALVFRFDSEILKTILARVNHFGACKTGWWKSIFGKAETVHGLGVRAAR